MFGGAGGAGNDAPCLAVEIEFADALRRPFAGQPFEFGAEQGDAQVIVAARVNGGGWFAAQAPHIRDGQRFAPVVVVDAGGEGGIGSLDETQDGGVGGPAEVAGDAGGFRWTDGEDDGLWHTAFPRFRPDLAQRANGGGRPAGR